MRCIYCNSYSIGNRMENGSRFCSERRSVVSDLDTTCEQFTPSLFFWCRNTDCWIDVNICTARQAKEAEECKKCYQRQEVLEVRRAMGRKPKINIPRDMPIPIIPEVKPKVLIRR